MSHSGVRFGGVNGCVCVRSVRCDSARCASVRCDSVRCEGVRRGAVCRSITSAASSHTPFPCRRGLSLAGRGATRYVPRGANSYLPRGATRCFPRVPSKSSRQITRYIFRGATTYLPRGANRYLPSVSTRYHPRGAIRYLSRGTTRYLPRGATRCPLCTGNSQIRTTHLHILHLLPLNWGVPLLVRLCACGGVFSPPPLAGGVAVGDVQVRVLLNLPDGLRKPPHPLGQLELLLHIAIGEEVTRQHPRTGGSGE